MTGIVKRAEFLRWLKFVLLANMLALPSILTAENNETTSIVDIQSLLDIEHDIQEVVRKNMNIVVAVTDGIGYGSGVIVSQDGLVLTAGHVLMTGGSNLRVIFPDGREVKAESLGRNLDVDAGMIKLVEPGPWEFAEKGKISELKKGIGAFASGIPVGTN